MTQPDQPDHEQQAPPQAAPPESPFTLLAMGMVQLHEMYTSAKEAGFGPRQAFDLAKTTFVEAMRANAPCPHCGRTR